MSGGWDNPECASINSEGEESSTSQRKPFQGNRHLTGRYGNTPIEKQNHNRDSQRSRSDVSYGRNDYEPVDEGPRQQDLRRKYSDYRNVPPPRRDGSRYYDNGRENGHSEDNSPRRESRNGSRYGRDYVNVGNSKRYGGSRYDNKQDAGVYENSYDRDDEMNRAGIRRNDSVGGSRYPTRQSSLPRSFAGRQQSSMKNIPGSSSAYDHFATADDEEFDSLPAENATRNGIDSPDGAALSRRASTKRQAPPPPVSQMPEREVILRDFEEYLEVMSPLSETEEDNFRKLSIEQKWRVVFNPERQEPLTSAREYVSELQRHCSTPRPPASVRRRAEDGQLSYWLRKLKMDLKFSHEAFCAQFASQSLGGVIVLVEVLRSLQREKNTLQTQRAPKDLYNQTLIEEYHCLLCIKFTLAAEEAVNQLAARPADVETVALNLMGDFRKSSTAVLEILTLLLHSDGGYSAVSDATAHLRVKFAENIRFKFLVGMLNSSMTNGHFQAVCVQFFNELLRATVGPNAKVYIQYELEQAGFDPYAMDRYAISHGSDYDEVQHELDTWRRNYINVASIRDDLTQLSQRSVYLREEINRLTASLEETTQDKTKLQRSVADLTKRGDAYHDKNKELQEGLNRMAKSYREKTGAEPTKDDVRPDLYEPLDPLDPFGSQADLHLFDSQRHKHPSASSTALGEAPKIVPPAPPPEFLSKTVRQKVATKSHLPSLNWVPLYSIRHTLFEDIDDEEKLREIDFMAFEEEFHLNKHEESQAHRARREKALQKLSEEIHFVEPNRAKNMIITMKRTGLQSSEISEAVDACDTDKLSGECAELLLKFAPTKDELKMLAQHADDYASLGEAEEFSYQMARVERFEKKLSLMTYMSSFEDLLETVTPNMEAVYLGGLSVLGNIKLKKIFEIILAFGNYMNSGRRGYALGFRIESLSRLCEVKSTDKKKTLLHYVVSLIQAQYPELVDFHVNLKVDIERGVSYQSTESDVLGLRKGLELAKYEQERQNSNPAIDAFVSRISGRVGEVTEIFRKMQETYQYMCGMFGEDFRSTEPDDIFKRLADFVRAFKEAESDIQKLSEPEEVTPAVSSSSTPRSVEPRAVRLPPPAPQENIPPTFKLKPVPPHQTPMKRQLSSPELRESQVYDDTLVPPRNPPTSVEDPGPRNSNVYDDIITPVAAASVVSAVPETVTGEKYVTKIKIGNDDDMNPTDTIYQEIPKKRPMVKPEALPVKETISNVYPHRESKYKGGELKQNEPHSMFFGAKKNVQPEPKEESLLDTESGSDVSSVGSYNVEAAAQEDTDEEPPPTRDMTQRRLPRTPVEEVKGGKRPAPEPPSNGLDPSAARPLSERPMSSTYEDIELFHYGMPSDDSAASKATPHSTPYSDDGQVEEALETFDDILKDVEESSTL